MMGGKPRDRVLDSKRTLCGGLSRSIGEVLSCEILLLMCPTKAVDE